MVWKKTNPILIQIQTKIQSFLTLTGKLEVSVDA